MTPLHAMTATELLEAMHAGELSPIEVTDHYLERIDTHAGVLGAFVTVTEDLARTEAKEAERRILTDEAAALPPLLGLPIAFKDLHPVGGVRTTFGCKVFEDFVPVEDSWTVGLIRRAGSVTVGMTHAPEFGPTCYTETDVVERPAVTPYDRSRYASGSSGGAAAAVAAGLIPVGHGSDGAGSVRTPAAVCGLVGIKPSRGQVSLAPASSFISWGTEGPLARTVADAALLLDVMAQPSAGDIYTVERPQSFLDAAQREPARRLRVARFVDPGLGVTPDPEAVAAVDTVTEVLRADGHNVEEVRNPTPWTDELLQAMLVFFGGGMLATINRMVPAESRQLLRPYTKWCVELGERTSSGDYVAALTAIAAAASAHLSGLADFDVVLTPTSSAPAVPVGYFHADGLDEVGRRMLGWSAYTPWANLTGRPSMSLPAAVSSAGLPLGVQLTASTVGAEPVLISVAAQVEKVIGWADRHPPQW